MADAAQWLTVKQFADAAGVSAQAVYQRLDKDLKSYLKHEKGHKYIDSAALAIIGNSSELKKLENKIKELENKIKELYKQLNDEKCAGEQIQQDMKAVSAERDSFRMKYDDLNKETAVNNEKMQGMQVQLSAARSQIDEQKQALEKAAHDLDTMREQLNAAQIQAAAASAALDEAHKQIDTHIQTIAALTTTFQNEQSLRAGRLLQDKQSSPKQGFFSRLFRRRKDDQP